MPYDAIDYSKVLWEGGKPYWTTASGKKSFIPPLVAAQMRDSPEAMAWAKQQGVSIDYQTDPTTGQVTVGSGGVTNTAAPGASLFKQRGEWDPNTGSWDQPFNWSNLMSIGVGGLIAAPVVAGALAGGAGGAAAGGSTAALGPTTSAGMAATTAASAAPASIAGGVGAGAASGGFGALLGGKTGLAISAGSDVAKAAISANAAKNAAKTQSAAADKSLAFQQGIYGQQQQNFAPYLAQGQNAVQQLGQRAAQPSPTFRPGQPQSFQAPPQMPMASLGQPQQGMAPQGAQGGLWTIQAPDGTTKQLPAQMAQQFVARGAKRVG